MKIDVLPDSDTVAREMAKFIAAEARAAILGRGRYLFAVSGGHTPWLMLRALAGEAVPWAEVHLVQVDERWLPRGTLTAISSTDRKVSWRASRRQPNTFTPCRPGDRHEDVRGVGPAQGAAEEVRLRAGGVMAAAMEQLGEEIADEGRRQVAKSDAQWAGLQSIRNPVRFSPKRHSQEWGRGLWI